MNRRITVVFGLVLTAIVIPFLFHAVSGKQQHLTNPPVQLARDFELKTLDGRTIKLSDFRGKAAVLNFWATWCAPCRVETPWLIDLYSKYKAEGLEVIGVSMDDGSADAVRRFVDELKVNYTILRGDSSTSEKYGGVRFLPHTFFIDRSGKIIGQSIGLKSRSDLNQQAGRLLHATDP